MKLENLALIDLEKLEEKIADLKQELQQSEALGDTIRAGIEYFEIKTLEELKQELIPAKKLAELSFEAGRQAHLESRYQYSSKTYETEKEEFLNHEIDLT